MRIADQDRKSGTVRLVVECADDLWYLRTLIEPGDTATGSSEYKEKLGGTETKSQVARRRVWVQVQVERVEWSPHAGRVRVLGIVTDGSEEVPRGSHHGLDIGEGEELTLHKVRWLTYHHEKLEEAARTHGARTLVVLFDRERATFVGLRPHGHETLAVIEGDVPKKGWETGKAKDFMAEIAKTATELAARTGAQHIIAASPAFWRAELERALPNDLRAKVIFASVSDADERALGELLGKPEVQAALAQERAAQERGIVERVLAALAKDRLVYGHADVKAALTEGNLSELIVTETAIAKSREDGTADALEGFLQQADSVKATVRLLSTPEGCGRIDGLGGVVGVRRW